jgi:hypothetical protein
VLVKEGRGVGEQPETVFDKSIRFTGKEVKVQISPSDTAESK